MKLTISKTKIKKQGEIELTTGMVGAKLDLEFSDDWSGLIEHFIHAEGGEDVQNIPASTTKVLTVLTAMDYVVDYGELITLDESDILGGTGHTFSRNATISVEDAMYEALMESSNTMAHALARHVGNIILNRR